MPGAHLGVRRAGAELRAGPGKGVDGSLESLCPGPGERVKSGTHRLEDALEECPLPGGHGLADAGVGGAAIRARPPAASNRLPGGNPR